jgi:hypothetical protein
MNRKSIILISKIFTTKNEKKWIYKDDIALKTYFNTLASALNGV